MIDNVCADFATYQRFFIRRPEPVVATAGLSAAAVYHHRTKSRRSPLHFDKAKRLIFRCPNRRAASAESVNMASLVRDARQAGCGRQRSAVHCSSTSLPSLYSKRRSRDRKDKPSRLSLERAVRAAPTRPTLAQVPGSPTSTHVEPGRRRAHDSIRGFDFGDEGIVRRTNAEPSRIAGGQRN